jgi:parvulin-like peptidyl-prolyl isomerase
MLQDAQFMLREEAHEMTPEDWERAVLEQAVRISAIPVLFAEYASKNDIYLSAMEVGILREELREMEEWHGAEEFDRMLRSDGFFGTEHLMTLVQTYSLMEKVMDTIVDSSELFASFEHYLEDAPEIDEELVAAKHILIFLDDFDSEEEAMAFANGIWERAIAGEDFDALIFNYGQDPGMFANPNGYTFTDGVMDPVFFDAANALEIGEISEPVSGFHGIHIILRVEPNPDDVMRPWGVFVPTLEQRMMQAVYTAFEAKLDDAELVFLPELYMIPVM